jgi:dinuclear metal center YbgI/SA1388 family protein
MIARVRNILEWIDRQAPFRYAASWDNCGLQVGDPEAPVERVLVALDPSSWSIGEAEARGCGCLVTHHPLLLRPIKTVRPDSYPGSAVFSAIRKGINLIAAHTNLDAAVAGTNDQLAKLLLLENLEPLEVEAAWRTEPLYGGMGKIGMLKAPITLRQLAENLREALGTPGIRMVGDPVHEIHRVALCTGSGGSLMEFVIARGCDVYVTGDVKYHEAQLALEAGLCVLDIGHFPSERLIVKPMADYLQVQANLSGVSLEVLTALIEKDPFKPLG